MTLPTCKSQSTLYQMTNMLLKSNDTSGLLKKNCSICKVFFSKKSQIDHNLMVYASTFWLNSFPPDDSVSTTISSRTIITGYHIHYNKHCSLKLGSYFQTHKEHNNFMIAWTIKAVSLQPTENI
jgi:hypothetical protein